MPCAPVFLEEQHIPTGYYERAPFGAVQRYTRVSPTRYMHFGGREIAYLEVGTIQNARPYLSVTVHGVVKSVTDDYLEVDCIQDPRLMELIDEKLRAIHDVYRINYWQDDNKFIESVFND